MTTPAAPEPSVKTPARGAARDALIGAAIALVRTRGYAATSVDDLCRAAGVTKGAFFHHFESKDALAVAAAEAWSAHAAALFDHAPYRAAEDPLERVLAYVDHRRALIDGPPEAFTCFAGTTVQEAFASRDAVREACRASIFGHAASLEADFQAAIDRYGVPAVTARGLALHTQAVLQGAFVLAKAGQDASVATDSVDHLRRYLELLFTTTPKTRGEDR